MNPDGKGRDHLNPEGRRLVDIITSAPCQCHWNLGGTHGSIAKFSDHAVCIASAIMSAEQAELDRQRL